MATEVLNPNQGGDPPLPSLHVYQFYDGLWRDIDNDNLNALSFYEDLETLVNTRDLTRGYTPLHLACVKKNYDIICFLLQWGADPNISKFYTFVNK
jgi:hypothetical protein